MSLEAATLDDAQDFLDLPPIVNVFRENVFIQRVTGRTVNKH
jgi:hypothetical protein